MSAFGKSSIDYFTERADNKTSIFPSADGMLCLNSADKPGLVSNPGNLGDFSPHNKFIISNRGVLLAGSFSGVKVAEVNFPYLIPNVNTNNNSFILERILYPGPVNTIVKIQIPTGFYTATTLTTTVNSAILAAIPGTGITLSYNPSTLQFTMSTANPNEFFLLKPRMDDNLTAQSLLTLIGLNYQNDLILTNSLIGSQTTMQYSRFIDFTSDVLSQYQEMNDTSTAKVNRRHIFCRLYVSTDVSMPSTDASGNPIFAGSSIPFVIYRQFKNPKTLKWNGKDSIDRIDVEVWDENGDPFYFPPGYPGFQFTFQAVE